MTLSEFEHIAQELRSQMLKVALDFFGSQDDYLARHQRLGVRCHRFSDTPGHRLHVLSAHQKNDFLA